MADSDTGEKTEEATPEKLKKAREEGNVLKSQDIIFAIKFIVTFSALAALFSMFSNEAQDFLLFSLSLVSSDNLNFNGLLTTFATRALYFGMYLSIFVLAIELITGLLVNYLQVGVMFTTKPLTPKFENLNPVNGLKGIFKMKKLVELIKNLIKFVAISVIAYVVLKDELRNLILLVRMPIWEAAALAGAIIWKLSIRIAMVFTLLAVADYFYQRHSYNKEQMMSKYDIKQEYKQQEGDPETKGKRRQLAHELIFNSGASQVPKASAVVANPDHVAVAISYDKDKANDIPSVVCKGLGKFAEQIKEIARKNHVPIVRNVPLAHTLYKLDIGEEIPEELYEAVAEILNFVYQLQQQKEQLDKQSKVA